MEQNERKGHISVLFSALQAAWKPLETELGYLRERYVASLVTQNSEEVRGKIKMIDELLRLPETLRQELNQME